MNRPNLPLLALAVIAFIAIFRMLTGFEVVFFLVFGLPLLCQWAESFEQPRR
jgi:hypothetical protein